MNRASAVEILVINAVLVPLLVLIAENYGLRMAYWASEGFTATMTRYPLFFITSAVRGGTQIPGLFSVDWEQVMAIFIIVIDGLFLRSALKERR